MSTSRDKTLGVKAHQPRNSTSKTTNQIKQVHEKILALRKMEAERQAAKRFEEITQPVWYDLAEEEAILLTIHALAYIADKTAMVSQIKTARRNFQLTVSKLSLSDISKQKDALQKNEILSRGRSEIKLSEPDYNTDDDLVNGPQEKNLL